MEEKINKEIYESELMLIKSKIKNTYKKVAYTVNTSIVLLYYEIGGYINSHKKWGSKYIQNLANDLKDEVGMSYRNLQYMRRLNEEFSYDEIMHQFGAQIPWRTLIEIISKCKTKESRLWYISKTYENGWSRSSLVKQIKSKAYERNLVKPLVSKGIKEYDSPLINEIIKDTYVLDISKKSFNNEKELKDKIIDNILDFLKELGKGFALVGREYKLKAKSKTYYIDILMYHVRLHAYVVIEIKLGEYKVEYLGQLKNYVKLVNEIERDEKMDRPTIGILLCKSANETIVKTTMEDETVPLILSKYIFLDEIKAILEK